MIFYYIGDKNNIDFNFLHVQFQFGAREMYKNKCNYQIPTFNVDSKKCLNSSRKMKALRTYFLSFDFKRVMKRVSIKRSSTSIY